MDYLTSLTSHLKELLKGIDDESLKENIIFEHIKHAEKVDIVVEDFPPSLDWFNTSQPLSSVLLQGKIVVLDFFTYCCINCLHIIPHLRQLEENFSVVDGLVVIGVHSAKFENEKNSENILSALKKFNISHPVVNDKQCFLWDQLEISCWPTLVILGPQRQPIFVLVGEGSKEDLLLFVKVALKFYSSSILPHQLPLITCDQIVSSNVLSFPGKITCHNDLIAVSDSGNHRILILDSEGSIKYKVGGESPGFKDGLFEAARFNSPQGLVFYDSSKLFIADTENHAIRLVDIGSMKVSTVAGTGFQGMDYVGGKVGTQQEISSPWDVCIVPCSDVDVPSSSLFTGDAVRRPVDIPELQLFNKTNVSNPPPPPSSQQPPPPPPPPGNFSPLPPKPLPKTTNTTSSKVLLIAAAGTHQIWAYFIDDGVWWKGKKYSKNTCVAVAGSGKEENRNNRYPMMASFAQPSGLSYSEELKAVFVADSESSSIRKISLKDGSVSHVVGGTKSPDDLFSFGDIDGKGYEAKLQHPLGVAWNSKVKSLFVCDTYNHKIKEVNFVDDYCKSIEKVGNVFKEPGGCCFDKSEDILYVADTNNNSIKKFNLYTGNVKMMTPLPNIKSEIPRDQWEHEITFPKAGGPLSLTIEFKPSDVHGTWFLESENITFTVDARNGKVNSTAVNLELEVEPSDKRGVIKLFFDLVQCGDESCKFRRFILTMNVKMIDLPKEKKVIKLLKSLNFS